MGFEYGPYRPGEQQIEADDEPSIETLLDVYTGICAVYGLDSLTRESPAQRFKQRIVERFEALSERVAWLEQGGGGDG